ncbi:MAG: hypothetical protein ACYDFT_05275 [Thermoplasmata archaeon]
MYPSMDEVTSKVAYAYAKQQAGVVTGFGLLALAPGIAALQGSTELAAAAGLLTAIPGAAFLYITATTTNLEKVGHAAKRVFPAAALLLVGLLAFSIFLAPLRHGSAQLADLGGLWVALLGVVSYPLPIRRGSVVLYRPAAVRQLADRRAVGLGLGLLAGLSAFEFLPGGLAAGDASGLTRAVTLLAFAAGLVGAALFVARRDSPGTLRPMEITGIASGLLLGAAGYFSGHAGPALWLAVGPLAIAVLTVAVVHLLSPLWTTGRKIIAHRA